MFDYRYVNIAYGTLTGFVAPGEGPVYRPAKNDYERWNLYHPQKARVNRTDLEIPEGILYIGDGAFENCFALNAVTIPESVTGIGLRAFRSCHNLREITFPSGLKKIRREAFAYCSGLTKLYVPDSVESIGEDAFANCDHLQEIRLPDAFSQQVKRIFGDDVDRMFLDMQRGKLKVTPRMAMALTGIIKGKWSEIAAKFIDAGDCEKMGQYLALWEDRPVSAEKLDGAIERSVQKKKTDMTALLIEYKNRYYSAARQEAKRQREAEKAMGLRNPTVSDWQRLFSYHTEEDGLAITRYKGNDTVVEVPAMIGKKPVIAIENWTMHWRYDDMDEPYRVVLPEGVREIRKQAFQYCSHLENIVIPKTVKEIGQYAFYSCHALKSVEIPEEVSCIQSETFGGCSNLCSVLIPESVRVIYWNAFYYCKNLREITLPKNVKDIYTSEWYNPKDEKTTVLVPKGSLTERTIKTTKIPYQLV